jgi:3-oxoacyl-[acyl-carrier protein] reductase
VSNAGITADQLFVLMSNKEWHSVIDTSLHGFHNIARPVLEKMVVDKKGAIVAIASVSAMMGNRGQANYAAAKAGLIGASRAIAAEVARLGVRVNVVAPGLIDTDMIKNFPLANLKSLIPMAPGRATGRGRKSRPVSLLGGCLLHLRAGHLRQRRRSANGVSRSFMTHPRLLI